METEGLRICIIATLKTTQMEKTRTEQIREQVSIIRDALAKIQDITPRMVAFFAMEADADDDKSIIEMCAMVDKDDQGFTEDFAEGVGGHTDILMADKNAKPEARLVFANFTYLLSLLHFGMYTFSDYYRKGMVKIQALEQMFEDQEKGGIDVEPPSAN